MGTLQLEAEDQVLVGEGTLGTRTYKFRVVRWQARREILDTIIRMGWPLEVVGSRASFPATTKRSSSYTRLR